MHTSGYGGRKLKKKITVLTSDQKHRQVLLTVAGYIEKFVTISPKRVRLRGYAGETTTVAVKIIPENKYPFKIIGSGAINHKNIRFTIKEAEFSDKAGYILTVENLKKETGRYYDMISLKTDSQIKPLIKINVYGQILDPKQKIKK